MEFFKKAFAWLAEVSQKLPKVDTNLFFIVVLAVIAGLGVVIAFTLLGSRARKLFLSSRKIRKYLANVDAVDDDNVSDFTAHCFSKKTPQALRDAWVQYLGVRFGYPSDIVSDSAVYDKLVKKNNDVRSGVFLGVSLVLLALFSFWGYGILSAPEMGTVHLVALLLIGALYLVLVILCRKQNQRCFETFEAMQEDLDAKVNLQIESNYATDSSPLQELNSMVEEIIARNTAKAVDIDDDNGQTPIEALIEQKMLEQDELDEIQQDDEDSSAQTEEQVLEPVEEATQDEQDEQDSDEQIGINDILQEQEASDEEQNVEESAQDISDETVESEEKENAEETDAQSEQAANESLEEVPTEDEDTTEEVSDETNVDEDTQVEDTTEGETLEEENESFQDESSDEEIHIEDDNQIEEEPQAEDVAEEPQTEDDVEESQDEQGYVEAQESSGESDEQIEEQQEEVDDEQNVKDENQEQNDFESEDESTEDEESVEENPQADESDDNLEQEQSEEVVEEEENSEEVASEQEQDEEDNSEQEETFDDEEREDEVGEETEESEVNEDHEEPDAEKEPEVVYVVDGDEDEEEHVKPAKLVKLPNLVDYMLSKNMPKAMKIQIATMLIGTYNKFKDSKEDRKIVVQCLTKVMRDLQNNK